MLATNVARTYAEIVTEYWEKAGVAMKERLTARSAARSD